MSSEWFPVKLDSRKPTLCVFTNPFKPTQPIVTSFLINLGPEGLVTGIRRYRCAFFHTKSTEYIRNTLRRLSFVFIHYLRFTNGVQDRVLFTNYTLSLLLTK